MYTLYLKRDELAHYGVQGQKWGVRRYQDESGALTEEGRLHYGISDSQRSSGVMNRSYTKGLSYNNYKLNKSFKEDTRKMQRSLNKAYKNEKKEVRNAYKNGEITREEKRAAFKVIKSGNKYLVKEANASSNRIYRDKLAEGGIKVNNRNKIDGEKKVADMKSIKIAQSAMAISIGLACLGGAYYMQQEIKDIK